MAENYRDEWRHRDAMLAVAMKSHVWLRSLRDPNIAILFKLPVNGARDAGYRDIDGTEAEFRVSETCPRFHAETPEGYWWRAKLLEWLAIDRQRWNAFQREFSARYGILNGTWRDQSMVAFLSTPAQVAEAADRAIQEMRYETIDAPNPESVK